MQTVKAFFVIASILLSGCRIIQTAGPGGDIVSRTGTYDCAEGQTCTVDVENGTVFSDTFTAVPREGYAFAGWIDAKLHLCGGSTEPCALEGVPGALTEKDIDLLLAAEFYHQPEVLSPGAAAVEFSVWSGGAQVSPVLGHMQAVDLNGDGADDLVVTGATYPNEPFEAPRAGLILLNDGNNNFTEAAGDRPMSVHAREILAADFDGNGLNDIFIADHGWDANPFPGWSNQLMLQFESGFVDASDRLPDDADGFTHNAAVGDIDNDGDVDILVLNNGGTNTLPYFAINDGSGHFSYSTDAMPDSWRQGDSSIWWTWAAELADLDGDGFLDLLIGGSGLTGNRSHVFWGNPAGQYSDEARTVLPVPASATALGSVEVISTRVTDIDGDGLKDLLLGAYDLDFTMRSLQILINGGERSFMDQTQRRLGDTAYSAEESWQLHIREFDFNGDGTLDLVPEGYQVGSGNILAWLNDGTGHYATLRTTDIANTDAVTRLAFGTYVRAGASFKALEVFTFEGQSAANAGAITEGAVITRPD